MIWLCNACQSISDSNHDVPKVFPNVRVRSPVVAYDEVKGLFCDEFRGITGRERTAVMTQNSAASRRLASKIRHLDAFHHGSLAGTLRAHNQNIELRRAKVGLVHAIDETEHD